MSVPPIEEHLTELNTSLTDSTRILAELVLERSGLMRDNDMLRAKLKEALEHLAASRAHAMKLAEELAKLKSP